MNGLEKISPLLKKFISRGPAGCSCSVSLGDQTVFSDYAGYAELESKKPIAPDTIFRIYSMSKVITCTAALQLFEQGHYLLNDPLYEYLPEFKNVNVCKYNPSGAISYVPASQPILVKHLFTMSSGYTYGGDHLETARRINKVNRKLDEGKSRVTVRDYAKMLAEEVPLAFEPGKHWQYGLSHDILGAFIEVISGKTFGQYLNENIFEPLDMKDTFFRIPDSKKDRLCAYYRRSEDGTMTKITNADDNYQPDALYESGGGGLLSTLGDYTRFAQTLACGGTRDGVRILGRKTIELMATNHLSPRQLVDFDWPYQAGYGYGLGVRTMIDKPAGGCNGTVGEFGWCGLAGTWVLVDPSENLSAVYMQQMDPNFEAYHQPRLRAVIYGAL